ncbi:MAG: hypothetical protein JO057_08900 [Chloroflexi bacterium]|nr:hypothetical protein [Chloroflexota bacterium]
MSVSLAAPARAEIRAATASPTKIYAAALAFWMATRVLVLAHQGAWPWMNSFVVDAARGILVGDWNDAVRPQLPAVLGVPIVLAGANEQQTVAVLYLLASLVQFVAFVVALRAIFPDRLQEQSIGLLVFVLIPFNHSIHHYRDMPVVLASAAIFLLSADIVRRFRTSGPQRITVRDGLVLIGLMLLGIWSRIEVLAFVAVLLVGLLLVYRRRALTVVAAYAAAAIVVTGTLLVMYQIEAVDLSQAWFYTAHTFLDSTPDSWLSPACRANPTENCRETDGLSYFGPANLRAGVLPLAINHPWVTVEKSVRSAWDNTWILVGPNLSTFPGIVPFLLVLVVLLPAVRDAYREIPKAAWLIVVAIMAESVLPPLTWAPPHPQYHVALVLPFVVLLVPALLALVRMPRGRWVALGFAVVNVGLSAFRYTRYPGY